MNKDTPKALDAVSEREAFEAHYKYLSLARHTDPWLGPRYSQSIVQDLWDGWQARAALSTSTQQAAKSAHGCQGPECRDGILHKSDCAVHNGDALPVGPCDCGAANSAAPAAVAQEIAALIVRDVCETDPVDPEHPDTVCVNVNDLAAMIVDHLPATQAPAAVGLSIKQEPKYTVNGHAIVNRASGEEIPADEPVFIFRARDVHAASALDYYQSLVPNSWHANVVYERVRDFRRFAKARPERMKEPDTAATTPTTGGEQ